MKNAILDSKEKIEFYRTKMQELVSSFYYDSCTSGLLISEQQFQILCGCVQKG